MACLKRNQSCRYGRKYQFHRIDDIESYQRNVPIVSYEDIAPMIAEVAGGKENILFNGAAIALEQTGGSCGGPKLIPYSPESLLDFRQALDPWIGSLLSKLSSDGLLYWSISPALRQVNNNHCKVPVGVADSEYMGKHNSRLYLAKSVIPNWINTVASFEDWQLATLYWLVRHENLEMISVWSPTFIIRLLDGLKQRATDLLCIFTAGALLEGNHLPAEVKSGKRLELSLERDDYQLLWPQLKWISCWCDASSRPFAAHLQNRLPQADIQAKGLIMTEAVITVPDAYGKARLSPHGFFEFMDDSGNLRLPEDLLFDESYEVILTSAGGLYRYRTGDWVSCTGSDNDHYQFEFRGRVASTVDLVGEKLTEAFVSSCLAGSGICGMLVVLDAESPAYALLVDETDAVKIAQVTEKVENRLRINPQYRYARELGQLSPLTGIACPDLLELYCRYKTRKGQSLGDIKFPVLCADADWINAIKDRII